MDVYVFKITPFFHQIEERLWDMGDEGKNRDTGYEDKNVRNMGYVSPCAPRHFNFEHTRKYRK